MNVPLALPPPPRPTRVQLPSQLLLVVNKVPLAHFLASQNHASRYPGFALG